MKTAIVLLLAVALAAAVDPMKTHTTGDFSVERQKDILYLFKFIQQPSSYKSFLSVPFNYPLLNEQLYAKPQVVKEFQAIYTTGFLPKGEIFSMNYRQHKIQAIALYRLFYYAKDYDTFFNTAVWARQHINEQMFVYILSVALAHRPDTQQFILPPIYEIYPHFFYSSEVIQEAQMYKQMLSSDHSYVQVPVITANYSGNYLYLSKEQSMSYYTEDVALNAFYHYYDVHYPPWLDESETSYQQFTKRGISYAQTYLQFLARYHLERLSNGLGHVPFLDIESSVVETGFYPSLTYPNGLAFPIRPDGANLKGPIYVTPTPYNINTTMSFALLKNYARRIHEAISLGYAISSTGEKIPMTGVDGLKILIDILHGTTNSINLRYYGSLPEYAKYVYGYSYVPHGSYKLLPSVLEQTQTAIRDPMFYQIYKWINMHIQRYIDFQSHYTYQDLLLPGVKIQNFEIDRLVTYFDYYYTDISNALYVNENEFNQEGVLVKVRQLRLKNKPFQFKLNVQSSEAQDVMVKLFIGPKYDELNNEASMHKNYWNYVILDYFPYTLKVGQNVIERDVGQSPIYFPDETTYNTMYSGSVKRFQESGHVTRSQMKMGFPARLKLPKGTPHGQTYQMYAIVTSAKHSPSVQVFLPKLYPMDKTAEMGAYEVPNAVKKDVVIYSKSNEELMNFSA